MFIFRFPKLYPILKPDYAADEIVSAVLRGESQFFLPRDFAVTFALKA
jgi:hypothetical protein